VPSVGEHSFVNREYNSKRSRILLIIAGVILVLITASGLLFYNLKVADFKITSVKAKDYKYYYVMITENMDSPFWQNVYSSAKTTAAEDGAYVELLGSNLSADYSLSDLMRIAIASNVDGIIMEPNGDTDISALINEASDKGIPVITVSEDEPQSARKGFVGVNSYSLGQKYASEVVKSMNKDTRNILVLTNMKEGKAEENAVFTEIKERVIASSVSTQGINVSAININSQKDFDSEEKIRDIILNSETLPDILVCLDATDTECAYQAVREYNLVGEVTIIGYYSTETILTAINKNIIESTFAVDDKEMGEYSVDALTEYLQTGHANDIKGVDITIINKANVAAYLVPEETTQAE